MICHAMDRLQTAFGVALFGILTLTVFLQVVTRFVIQLPLLWSEEVARFLLFWLVMNGAALAVHRSRHYVIELFGPDPDPDSNRDYREQSVQASIRFTLLLIPAVCTLSIGIAMLVYGFEYVIVGSYRVMPISRINMQYVYAAIPYSGLSISIYSGFHLWQLITKPPLS